MATSQDGRIAFDNILNFRDISQYINHTTGQNLLTPGLIFRSARPDAASAADRLLLTNKYKIKTIIDLRTPTEHIDSTRKHAAASTPSAPGLAPKDPARALRIPEITYKDVNMNGSSYSNALIKQLSWSHTAKLFTLYTLGYRKEAISVLGTNVMAARGLDGLAEDTLSHCRREVGDVFSLLCVADSYPVVIHCTQGKDRTGLVVLLVLLLCGVPEVAIEKDYRLSESELAPEREEKLAEIRSIGLPDSFAECPGQWCGNVCRFVEGTFGGVGKYLESCGVTEEQQGRLRDVLKSA